MNRPVLRPFHLLALVFVLLLGASAEARSPRETAEAIAAAIEANYYDPARATAVATDLRAIAASGRFDAVSDPRELANALTATLEPIDGHFDVTWSPPQAAPTQAAPGAESRRRGPARRQHGIRRVELLPGHTGLIDLAFFADFDGTDAKAHARVAIDAALQLVADADAVIIDLRDNGGGSPAMVGYLASAFVAPGSDIYNRFRRRGGSDSEAPARPHPAPRLEVPLYVLISARTGSAAEALAYTLRNAGRATIVGTTSAGAANPGGPVDVGEGFSVFVSDGSPVSPITQTNWEGVGVVPDIDVPAEDALRRARIHALQRITQGDDADPAARWTLEALQSDYVARTDALQRLAGDYGAFRVQAGDGVLQLYQGRRPVRRFVPLSESRFFDALDPTRRLVFDRDAAGRVPALELHYADGGVRRVPRGESTGD